MKRTVISQPGRRQDGGITLEDSVPKDVPSHTVVAGIPAKLVRNIKIRNL